MCACDNRQLTQAQREAGFEQLRNAGVMQAVRPFSGSPTLPNLIDYVNRELFPAVKQSRNKVNDVYRQVTDNAPSANPLAYYFSTETANADPTVGRLRLDNATQESATTVRVSQTNARLKDVAAWLDVMAGSATAPLGTLTLSDYADPNRFVRFDLNTMVDQGSYWDLGVTPIESSHDNPFVEDEGIVIAFIPGVAAAGATVPPAAIAPIAANTVLANATAAPAPPTAFPIPVNSVLGRVAGNIVAARIVTDQIADNQVDDTKIRNSGALSVIGRAANSSGDPADISASGALQYLRTDSLGATLEWGAVTLGSLPAQAADTFLGNITTGPATPVAVPLADVDSASIVYDATSHTFQRAALTGGDISASQNSNALTINDDAVTNAKLAEMAANTVKVNNTAATANPTDLAIGTNTVLGRRSGIILAGQIIAGQIADGNVTNPKLRDSVGVSVIGRNTNSTGQPGDIAASADDRVLARSGGSLAFQLIADPMIASGTIGLDKITGINANTVIGNDTASAANPVAIAIGTNTVLGRVGGNIVAAQVATGQIADDAVTDAKLRNSGALSVIGRAANSSGDPADISASASSGAVLRESGGALGFGTIATAGFADDAVTNAKLAEMAANTVKANATSGTANPTDFAIGTNTVLGRVGGDIVAAQVVTGQIADNQVDDDKLRNSGPLSVIGRAANSTGNPSDISATAASGAVLRESGSTVGFGTVATAGLADASVTLAKMADLAQSRIIGRAEGAGTGVPTALTPTQVMSIVDGENVAWTGNHSFTAATFTTDVTGAHSMESDGDMGIASVSGGLALGAGNVIVSPSVGNGDVVINATGGVAITAGGSPISDAAANDIVLQATDDVRLEATDQVLITSATVEVSGSTTFLNTGSTTCEGPVEFQSLTRYTGVSDFGAGGGIADLDIGAANVVRFTAETALTGMVPLFDGHFVLIVNAYASAALAIALSSGTSSAANQFAGSGTVTVAIGRMITAWYDGDENRWRLGGAS